MLLIFLFCSSVIFLKGSNKSIHESPETTLVLRMAGIYNSQVTKPSYKTKLRIMTPQTELLTLKFYFLKFFELVNRSGKKL